MYPATAVALCALAAVALVSLGLVVYRQRTTIIRLRRHDAELSGAIATRDEELRHLVVNRLPALAESARHRPVDVPGPLHTEVAATEYGQNLQAIVDRMAELEPEAMARAGQAAQGALRAVMKTVQSLAKEQQLAIAGMHEKHDDPHVLEGLLRIDHANAQLSRRAQAIAVLCGAWPGQQRGAAALTAVVRGATSRVRDYLRIKVHADVDQAVVSWAVEPVVLTLAELLDNAARYSAPNTTVEVNFQEAHRGMAIMIDDAGVGLTPEAAAHAETLLSGEKTADINALGDPPQVGFAVIGILAARYGFKVSIDTASPFGGVRAIVFLPSSLLTRVETPQPSAMAESAAAESRPAGPVADSGADAAELTSSGLPKRRRNRAAPPQPAQDQRVAAEPPERSAGQTAAALGAWQRGSQGGRDRERGEGNPQG